MKALPFFCLLLLHAPGLQAAELRVPAEHPTIQKAIDAATSGDLILVAPGTYGERIALRPDICLRSEKGAEETILDGGGEIEDGPPGVTMAEGATLEGFTVRNAGAFDEARWKKDWDEQGANQKHEHIGHFGTPGIAIEGVRCSVLNNIVHHNGSTGIAIRGEGCMPLVRGNTCHHNMGGGIGSMGGSRAIIDGNTCHENLYAGIGHDGASPVVTNNECYRNIRAGIGISEGASPIVRGNRCHHNRKAGIGVRTGADTRPILEENECFENDMAGIGADEEAAPLLRNNHSHGNQLAGIGCRGGAHPILIGNRSEKNQLAGIGVDGTSKAILLDNTCTENRLVALGVPAGGEVIAIGNTFTRTGGMPPMVAIFGGSKATLIDNTLTGGGIAAVLLGGELRLFDNRLEGTKGRNGVLVQEGASLLHGGNEIGGYANALSGPGKITEIDRE